MRQPDIFWSRNFSDVVDDFCFISSSLVTVNRFAVPIHSLIDTPNERSSHTARIVASPISSIVLRITVLQA